MLAVEKIVADWLAWNAASEKNLLVVTQPFVSQKNEGTWQGGVVRGRGNQRPLQMCALLDGAWCVYCGGDGGGDGGAGAEAVVAAAAVAELLTVWQGREVSWGCCWYLTTHLPSHSWVRMAAVGMEQEKQVCFHPEIDKQ